MYDRVKVLRAAKKTTTIMLLFGGCVLLAIFVGVTATTVQVIVGTTTFVIGFIMRIVTSVTIKNAERELSDARLERDAKRNNNGRI